MMVSMCGQLSFDQFNQVQMYVFGPDFWGCITACFGQLMSCYLAPLTGVTVLDDGLDLLIHCAGTIWRAVWLIISPIDFTRENWISWANFCAAAKVCWSACWAASSFFSSQCWEDSGRLLPMMGSTIPPASGFSNGPASEWDRVSANSLDELPKYQSCLLPQIGNYRVALNIRLSINIFCRQVCWGSRFFFTLVEREERGSDWGEMWWRQSYLSCF